MKETRGRPSKTETSFFIKKNWVNFRVIMKHTKLFYREIARIRIIGTKNDYVSAERIKQVFHTNYVRAGRLKEELISAGVLKELSKGEGNIIWENLNKYRVPKEITREETARVKKVGQ